MSAITKTVGTLAVFATFAAPALVAQHQGWTIFATPEPDKPVEQVESECEDLDARSCAAEKVFARKYNAKAAGVLKIGGTLATDQPRFTQITSSAIERPPEGEVYVIWQNHVVRIIEDSRKITKVYFNAL